MVEANPTTPSQKAELVSCKTSQPWATFCIQVPMLERKFPAQKRRKSRLRNARAIRGNSMTVVSAASVSAPFASPATASARGTAGSSIAGNSGASWELISDFLLNCGFELTSFHSVTCSFPATAQRGEKHLKFAKLTLALLLFAL